MMAKIFKNGSSQAVRLPKEYRFETDEVYINRIGKAIVLYPKGAEWELMAEAIDHFNGKFPPRDQPKKVDKRERWT